MEYHSERQDEANSGENEKAGSTGSIGEAHPKIDFSTFILSLFTTAQFQLGEIPNPFTQKFEQDLTLAVETIDIIRLLREKTAGNLNPEESKLIEDLLYTLKMSYIRKVEK